MTHTYTETLESSGLVSLVKKLLHPGISVCLLYTGGLLQTAEQEGNVYYI